MRPGPFRALPVIVAAVVALAGCAGLDPNNLVARQLNPPAPVADAVLDAPTRQAAFDYVWQTVNQHYVDANFHGVDWRAVGARYRAELLATRDDDTFWRRLDAMVGELDDAHTRVLAPRQVRLEREHAAISLGVSLRETDGELIVQSVLRGSEAALLGVRPGARVVSIDGVAALTRWRAVVHDSRGNSTPWARELYANREFNQGPLDQTVRLDLERPDHSRLEVNLRRALVPQRPAVASMRLSSGVGYLAFNKFDEALHDDLLAALAQLVDARGLIIDLRNNGGGSLRLARAVMERLVAGRVAAGRAVTRDGQPIGMLFGLAPVIRPELVLEGDARAYAGPLVILVNHASASASEWMAATLQGLGRARIIGETSCGCLHGNLGHGAIPGGGALAYSEVDFVMVDGRRIEGLGVVPDLTVPTRAVDLVNARDAALEVALERFHATRVATAATAR